MQHYKHTHTSDLSASLSCSTVAPGISFDSSNSVSCSAYDLANENTAEADLSTSFIAMIERLLERNEFEAVVAVASDLLSLHPGSLFLNFALGNAYSIWAVM